MKKCRAGFSIVAITLFIFLQPVAKAQSSSGAQPGQTQTQPGKLPRPPRRLFYLQPGLTYQRPSEKNLRKISRLILLVNTHSLAPSASPQFSKPTPPIARYPSTGIPPDWGQEWDSYGARSKTILEFTLLRRPPDIGWLKSR